MARTPSTSQIVPIALIVLIAVLAGLAVADPARAMPVLDRLAPILLALGIGVLKN